MDAVNKRLEGLWMGLDLIRCEMDDNKRLRTVSVLSNISYYFDASRRLATVSIAVFLWNTTLLPDTR